MVLPRGFTFKEEGAFKTGFPSEINKMMAVFSEENLRQCSSRGLERGTGCTRVFRIRSPHHLKGGGWGRGWGGHQSLRQFLSWRKRSDFPGGCFSFPEREEYSLMKCVRLEREAGPAWKPKGVLPAPTSRGIRCEAETPVSSGVASS